MERFHSKNQELPIGQNSKDDDFTRAKSKFITTLKGTNDVAWYKHYDQLTKDTASIIMSRPNGINYPKLHTSKTGTVNVNSTVYSHQGGFLRISALPYWGGTLREVEAARDAINTAASKLYYYIVHGNSRNISYDKSDLMKTLIAYDSAYTVICEAIRAYSFIKSVSIENKWVKNILYGLGWDYNDLMSNIVRFRTAINVAIMKMNQISIPDVFDIFKAHREMFSHVFLDRPGKKAQFMGVVSGCAWVYNDKYSALYAAREGEIYGLEFHWTDQYRTVEDFENLITIMISSIYDSTDIGVMVGDIKRAFSDSQLISMDMIGEDPVVPIEYDEEFNLKLHNMEMIHDVRYDLEVELDPDDPNNRITAGGMICDTSIKDGNLMVGLFENVGDQWANYKYEDSVHVMDLPDNYRDDVDAVLLMQIMKIAKTDSAFLSLSNGFKSGDGVNLITAAASSMIITGIQYFYNVDSPTTYLEFSDCDVFTANDLMTKMRDYCKLYELGITLPLIPILKESNYCTPMPSTWQVENVTVYSRDVLFNIVNTIVESLWYSPLLYNM